MLTGVSEKHRAKLSDQGVSQKSRKLVFRSNLYRTLKASNMNSPGSGDPLADGHNPGDEANVEIKPPDQWSKKHGVASEVGSRFWLN